MKLIINQLISFVKMYSLLHWISIILFCGSTVFINYKYNLQKEIYSFKGIDEFNAMVLLYASHSLFGFLMYSFFSGNYSFWRKPQFLFLLISAYVIFTLRAVVWQHESIIHALSEEGQLRINSFAFNNIFRLLYLVIPVTIIWLVYDKREMPLYGFSFKNQHLKIYWILLACMIPLIIGASFLSDFLSYYPRFKQLVSLNAGSGKIWLYEIFYGLDFISIELFFRGFLIIAFIKFVGPHAIVPMAVFYMSIHFGKPLGETISSFFGGCILGVISFHSRSILGGIMVHMGIAWLMELGAFLGNLIQKTWN